MTDETGTPPIANPPALEATPDVRIFTCWACAREKRYVHGARLPMPVIMRCKECAERDGDLKLSDWYHILSCSDRAAAYRRVLAVRKQQGA